MPKSNDINGNYGGRVRVRVCGILIQNHEILLVKHDGMGPKGELWLPPGGGVEFGEKTKDALIREFQEETGLTVDVGHLLFVNEHSVLPLHAVELFFKVTLAEGELKLGSDPELDADQQLITAVEFVSESKINAMPNENLHKVFVWLKNKEGLISFDSLLNLELKYLD